MFGSEQSFGMVSFKGRIYYPLFGHDHMGYRARAFHFKKMLARSDNPRYILDAGCGEGCYTFYLAQRFPTALVIGIDINTKLLANAESIRRQLGEVGRRISFIEGDLTSHCFDIKFDLIVCIDVLEHIIQDERVLKNIRNCLSERGKLLLHVPQRHQQNIYRFKNFERLERQSDHVRDEYVGEEILEKIEKAGLEVVEKRYTFGWFGSLSREVFYKIEELQGFKLMCKFLLAPFLILLAYLDTLTPNKIHQGFLFKLERKGK